MIDIIILGGGGHAKSVVDTIRRGTSHRVIGIIAEDTNSVLGIPVIGDDDDLEKIFEGGIRHAFIGVGSVESAAVRERLFKALMNIGYELPCIVDPSACVSDMSSIGEGVFVGKNAVVNINSIVKEMAIINTGAIVEHDCDIGAFAHIAPGAVIGGDVKIGDCTLVGSNASVVQGLTIGAHTVIGSGSVVVNNITSHKVAYGNPCREIKNISSDRIGEAQ